MPVHHLRLLVPAAAAAVWALGRLLGHHGQEQPPSDAPAADEDEGEEVAVELPAAGKGPSLPFPAPPALKAVLLDVEVPLTLPALWCALFHASSGRLADFHQHLGDLDIEVSPWRLKDDKRRRVLRYTTPLRNPLGPRQARNTEVMEIAALTPQGFCLRARCSSEGVPFASCFANHVQWVATPHGVHSSRLLVTGECQFHSPVWGPLKGQIERESVKGMAKAYRTLVRMLERQYGGVPTDASTASGASGAKPGAAAGGSSKALAGRPVALGADATAAGAGGDGEALNISALLQNPQANAAAFLALVVVMAVIWRLAVMNPLLQQTIRGAAAAVGGR